jgi:hypothetical protein
MPLFLSLASTESVSNLEAEGLVESFKSLRFLPYCLKHKRRYLPTLYCVPELVSC